MKKQKIESIREMARNKPATLTADEKKFLKQKGMTPRDIKGRGLISITDFTPDMEGNRYFVLINDPDELEIFGQICEKLQVVAQYVKFVK